jgi:Protein of unknown function (DUF3072)
MSYALEAGSPHQTARDEPMSERQADTLWRLCDEAGEPQDFDPTLSRRGAQARIDALRDEVRMKVLPPHTD